MSVSATLVRGGTSKCWVFDRAVVPATTDALSEMLIDLFGAQDRSQIDGVGGGTSVTSKAMVVGPASDPADDIDYLFGQVPVGGSAVEWGSNCGNCASAVALWSIENGYFDPKSGRGMRMRNRNTGALLEATVDQERRDVVIPGVAGTGTSVTITFVLPHHRPAADTGKPAASAIEWPTGRSTDTLRVDGLDVECHLFRAGTPVALVRAEQLGLPSSPTAAHLRQRMAVIGALRTQAGIAMGLYDEMSAQKAIPKLGILTPTEDYVTEDGAAVSGAAYDVGVRMISMDAMHPSIGLTAVSAIAALAQAQLGVLPVPADPSTVRIATPAGITAATVSSTADLTRVGVARSARVLARSELFGHHDSRSA
ncbi:PrpF, AcnD-accessory [Epidermidibacterium keratini]|uniref:PrpF, AcnD-accessory n=1 Tax=Epidermidibacterium keratini TaxID=1891644 RepID=A0A7L4YJ45_9ACTN|nr:PrpF domain-containing protein [Epidermidibacterium keratini]QHB98913.1 PrpF, AcnD-accessory [Epidermidibacterium keratini]